MLDGPDPMTWPVSCKGVVLAAGRVLLAENERDEWELPGGRLEVGESPAHCVAREVAEEAGVVVEVAGIIDSWIYQPLPDRQVLIVTYGCQPLASVPAVVVSSEHRDVRFIPVDQVDELVIPDGYRTSIRTWLEQVEGDR